MKRASSSSASLLRLLRQSPFLISSVLRTLTSEKTKEAYRAALLEFVQWAREREPLLSRSVVETWRAELVKRKLAVSSVNQRLSALRLFFRIASEHGVITADEAAQLIAVRNLKQRDQKPGHWLKVAQAGQLLSIPDPQTTLGQRDRALLALLVACGLRRDELVHLRVSHLQLREKRWVLLDLRGKGRRIRTVPVPSWVKKLLDSWMRKGGIKDGFLFRKVLKNGRVVEEPELLSDDIVYTIVKRAGAAIGKPELTPHDLRRTCAKLCRAAGGELEQIQLLLGHASVSTTERYLDTKQELAKAVNDRLRLPVRKR